MKKEEAIQQAINYLLESVETSDHRHFADLKDQLKELYCNLEAHEQKLKGKDKAIAIKFNAAAKFQEICSHLPTYATYLRDRRYVIVNPQTVAADYITEIYNRIFAHLGNSVSMQGTLKILYKKLKQQEDGLKKANHNSTFNAAEEFGKICARLPSYNDYLHDHDHWISAESQTVDPNYIKYLAGPDTPATRALKTPQSVNPYLKKDLSAAEIAVTSRLLWADIVRGVTEENVRFKKSLPGKSVESYVVARLRGLGFTVDANETFRRCVAYLQQNITLVVTFDATFMKDFAKKEELYYQPLNAHLTNSKTDMYKEKREKLEQATYSHFLSPEQKQFFNKHKEARPIYCAGLLQDHYYPISHVTNYGESYFLQHEPTKWDSIYMAGPALDSFRSNGKPLPKCTYSHLDLILYHCSDAMLRGIANRVTTGLLGKGYSQQYDGDPGYIEAHGPPRCLFDGVVQSMHIDPSEYKLTQEDEDFLEKKGIATNNQPEHPYIQLSATVMNAVELNDPKLLIDLLQRHPTLNKTANEFGETPLHIAVKNAIAQLANKEDATAALKCIAGLVKYGAGITVIDKDGNSPLSLAVAAAAGISNIYKPFKLLFTNRILRLQIKEAIQIKEIADAIKNGKLREITEILEAFIEARLSLLQIASNIDLNKLKSDKELYSKITRNITLLDINGFKLMTTIPDLTKLFLQAEIDHTHLNHLDYQNEHLVKAIKDNPIARQNGQLRFREVIRYYNTVIYSKDPKNYNNFRDYLLLSHQHWELFEKNNITLNPELVHQIVADKEFSQFVLEPKNLPLVKVLAAHITSLEHRKCLVEKITAINTKNKFFHSAIHIKGINLNESSINKLKNIKEKAYNLLKSNPYILQLFNEGKLTPTLLATLGNINLKFSAVLTTPDNVDLLLGLEKAAENADDTFGGMDAVKIPGGFSAYHDPELITLFAQQQCARTLLLKIDGHNPSAVAILKSDGVVAAIKKGAVAADSLNIANEQIVELFSIDTIREDFINGKTTLSKLLNDDYSYEHLLKRIADKELRDACKTNKKLLLRLANLNNNGYQAMQIQPKLKQYLIDDEIKFTLLNQLDCTNPCALAAIDSPSLRERLYNGHISLTDLSQLTNPLAIHALKFEDIASNQKLRADGFQALNALNENGLNALACPQICAAVLNGSLSIANINEIDLTNKVCLDGLNNTTILHLLKLGKITISYLNAINNPEALTAITQIEPLYRYLSAETLNLLNPNAIQLYLTVRDERKFAYLLQLISDKQLTIEFLNQANVFSVEAICDKIIFSSFNSRKISLNQLGSIKTEFAVISLRRPNILIGLQNNTFKIEILNQIVNSAAVAALEYSEIQAGINSGKITMQEVNTLDLKSTLLFKNPLISDLYVNRILTSKDMNELQASSFPLPATVINGLALTPGNSADLIRFLIDETVRRKLIELAAQPSQKKLDLLISRLNRLSSAGFAVLASAPGIKDLFLQVQLRSGVVECLNATNGFAVQAIQNEYVIGFCSNLTPDQITQLMDEINHLDNDGWRLLDLLNYDVIYISFRLLINGQLKIKNFNQLTQASIPLLTNTWICTSLAEGVLSAEQLNQLAKNGACDLTEEGYENIKNYPALIPLFVTDQCPIPAMVINRLNLTAKNPAPLIQFLADETVRRKLIELDVPSSQKELNLLISRLHDLSDAGFRVLAAVPGIKDLFLRVQLRSETVNHLNTDNSSAVQVIQRKFARNFCSTLTPDQIAQLMGEINQLDTNGLLLLRQFSRCAKSTLELIASGKLQIINFNQLTENSLSLLANTWICTSLAEGILSAEQLNQLVENGSCDLIKEGHENIKNYPGLVPLFVTDQCPIPAMVVNKLHLTDKNFGYIIQFLEDEGVREKLIELATEPSQKNLTLLLNRINLLTEIGAKILAANPSFKASFLQLELKTDELNVLHTDHSAAQNRLNQLNDQGVSALAQPEIAQHFFRTELSADSLNKLTPNLQQPLNQALASGLYTRSRDKHWPTIKPQTNINNFADITEVLERATAGLKKLAVSSSFDKFITRSSTSSTVVLANLSNPMLQNLLLDEAVPTAFIDELAQLDLHDLFKNRNDFIQSKQSSELLRGSIALFLKQKKFEAAKTLAGLCTKHSIKITHDFEQNDHIAITLLVEQSERLTQQKAISLKAISLNEHAINLRNDEAGWKKSNRIRTTLDKFAAAANDTDKLQTLLTDLNDQNNDFNYHRNALTETLSSTRFFKHHERIKHTKTVRHFKKLTADLLAIPVDQKARRQQLKLITAQCSKKNDDTFALSLTLELSTAIKEKITANKDALVNGVANFSAAVAPGSTGSQLQLTFNSNIAGMPTLESCEKLINNLQHCNLLTLAETNHFLSDIQQQMQPACNRRNNSMGA